jgi:hypothetical protein
MLKLALSMDRLSKIFDKIEALINRASWKEYVLFILLNFVISFSVMTYFKLDDVVRFLLLLDLFYIKIISISGVILAIWQFYKTGFGSWLFSGFIKMIGAIGLVSLMVFIIIVVYAWFPLLVAVHGYFYEF